MDKADKEIEGPDLAREQQWEEAQVERHEEEELPEAVTETVRDVSFEMRSRMFDALRLILAGEKVNVTLFYLPQREAHALEALQTAVTGNDSMGEFVYAEDRKALLEQSLAVLQQNLTYGDTEQISELQSKFDSMSTQVGDLRDTLSVKEDAQEDLEEWHNARMLEHGTADAGDKDDKPDAKPKPDAGLVDFIAEALFAMAEVSGSKSSTLAGEERPEPAWRSALSDGGPEAKHPPKKSSLYDEADLPAADVQGMHDPAPQRRVVKPKPTDLKKDE
jgi:hypothetical protein